MEVILGFAVGYWIGTNQGRQGKTALISSVMDELIQRRQARRAA